jgi:hypothetical protein
MKNKGLYSVAIAAVMTITLLVSVAVLQGCSASQIHIAAKSASGVAYGLATVEKENEILYSGGTINKAETNAIGNAVSAGTLANDAFAGCVRAVKDSGSSGEQQAIGCFRQLTDNLSKIEVSDLHVKNPDAEARIRLAWQSVNAALKTISAFLPENKT